VSSPDTLPITAGPAPLSGLASALLADPGLRTLVDAAGRDAAVEGPTALRPLLAAALSADPADPDEKPAKRTAARKAAEQADSDEKPGERAPVKRAAAKKAPARKAVAKKAAAAP